MARFFIDWDLKTGGEFVVEASSNEEAIDLAKVIVDIELSKQFLDSDEADFDVEPDTEPVDKHMLYYRKNSEGKIETYTPVD